MVDSSSKLKKIQIEIEGYKKHGYKWSRENFKPREKFKPEEEGDKLYESYIQREIKDEKLKEMLKKKCEPDFPNIIEFDTEEDKDIINNLNIESFNYYKANESYIYSPKPIHKEYDDIKHGEDQLIANLILDYTTFLEGNKTTDKYTQTHNKIFNDTLLYTNLKDSVKTLPKKYRKEILELFINEQKVSDDIKYMNVHDYNATYFNSENMSKYASINEKIFDYGMLNVRKAPPEEVAPKEQAAPQAPQVAAPQAAPVAGGTESVAPKEQAAPQEKVPQVAEPVAAPIAKSEKVASVEEVRSATTASPEKVVPPKQAPKVVAEPQVVAEPIAKPKVVPPKVVAPEKEEENNKKEFNELNEKYKGVPGLITDKYTKVNFEHNKILIDDYDKKFNNLYIYLRNLCNEIIYKKYIDVDGDTKWAEYKKNTTTYKNSKPQKYTKYIHILIYLEILRILSDGYDNRDKLAEYIKEENIKNIIQLSKILTTFYESADTNESFIIKKIMSEKEKIVILPEKKIKIDNLLKLQYISDEISPQLDKSPKLKGGAIHVLNDEDNKNVNDFNSYIPSIIELLSTYFQENMSIIKIKKKEISTNIATTIQEAPLELKETPNSQQPNKKDKESIFGKFKNMAMNMINKQKNPALEEKKGEDMKRELEKKKQEFKQAINDAEKRMDDGDENIVIIQKITAVIYKIILGTIILFTFIIIILHIINIIAFLYHCFIDIGDKYHSNIITRDTYRYKLLKYINYVKNAHLPALKNINTSSSGNQEIDNIKRKILKFTSMINIFKKKITNKYESKDEISDVIELKWSEEIKKASEADKVKFKSALEDYKTYGASKINPEEVFSKFNEGGTTKVLDFIKEIEQETDREEKRYQQAMDENLPLLDNEVEKEPELYIFFSLRFIYLSLKLYLAFFLLLLITFFIYIVINIALKKSSSKVEIPIFPNDVLFKTLVKIAMISLIFIFLNMIMFKAYFVKYIYGGIEKVYIEIDTLENYIRNVLTITKKGNEDFGPIKLHNAYVADDPGYYQNIQPNFKKLLDDNIEDDGAIMDYIINEIIKIDKKEGEIGPFDEHGEKIVKTPQQLAEVNYRHEYYWDYQRIKRDIILYILIKHLYNGNKNEKDKIIKYFIPSNNECIQYDDDDYDIIDESFYSLLANNYRNVPIGTFNFKNMDKLIDKEKTGDREIENKIYLKVAEELRYEVNEILHKLQNKIGKTNIEFDRENYLVNIGVYFFINLLISVIYLIIVNEIYKKSGYSIF